MIFSVLIPTLVDRRNVFAPLKRKIKRLIEPYKNEIELVIYEDSYQKSTGYKRNELVDRANGRITAFIDDDDDIPEYYFDSIIRTIKNNPCDCIGFKGIIHWNGKKTLFKHSSGLPYSKDPLNGVYLRPPNHLNPMLKTYMKEIGFPDKTFAEDFDFCNRLAQSKLVKNEVFLDVVMYHYHFNPKKKVAVVI